MESCGLAFEKKRKGNKMKTALALVSDNFEDLELMYPVIRMKEEGIDVVIAGDKVGHTYLGKHGYPCISSAQFQDLEGDQFDGVLIPGGFAPDRLRYNPAVLKLVKAIYTNNCPVAFICHGGWVPISANILKGKKVTGTIAIKDDFENAGAIWQDQALVVDGHLISSRSPKDLHLFGKYLAKAIIK